MRPAVAFLTAALLLPAAAGAARPGASDLQRDGRCETLTGRAVVSTAIARVVSRPVHELPHGRSPGVELVGRQFFGCSLPGGVVRPLGAAGRLYRYDRTAIPRRRGVRSTTRRTVLEGAGRFVLVRTHVETARTSELEGRVVDLASGRSYAVFHAFDDGGEGGEPSELSAAAPAAWRLSPLGVFAGVYPDLADDYTAARSVRAFTETGAQKVLARAPSPDIPTSALTLIGRTVGWTEADAVRSAEISAATPAYAPGLEPDEAPDRRAAHRRG